MASPAHSGDMSQDSARADVHPTPVPSDAPPRLEPAVARPRSAAIDPAARTSKRVYQGLNASSVGLELGISVILGLLFGRWLDGQLGTEPWMMLLFLVFGLIAGFRGVLRAIARVEKETE